MAWLPGVIKTYKIGKPIGKSFCGCCEMGNNFCSRDYSYRQSRMFPNTTNNSKIEVVLSGDGAANKCDFNFYKLSYKLAFITFLSICMNQNRKLAAW